jgi:hypothetical protein
LEKQEALMKIIALALLTVLTIACSSQPDARRDRQDRILERRATPTRGM